MSNPFQKRPQIGIGTQIRQDILDGIRLENADWAGELSETEFLSRIFDLKALPSFDSRYENAGRDIFQHRELNLDWDDYWLFADERFDLLNCPEKTFLQFLCETVHPVVRPDSEEAQRLVNHYNQSLSPTRRRLVETRKIAGKPVYTPGFFTESRNTRSNQFPKIWQGNNQFKLFISHISAHKKLAMRLKECLSVYGISAFVAHEDINPTLEWQIEIELALASMDAMVAFHTKGFSLSNWTQQEIGFALGADKKIIALKMDEDPTGFLSKHQALLRKERNGEQIAKEIYELLKDDPTTSSKILASRK